MISLLLRSFDCLFPFPTSQTTLLLPYHHIISLNDIYFSSVWMRIESDILARGLIILTAGESYRPIKMPRKEGKEGKGKEKEKKENREKGGKGQTWTVVQKGGSRGKSASKFVDGWISWVGFYLYFFYVFTGW